MITEEQKKKLETLYELLNDCEQRLKQVEHERNPIPHKGGVAPMGLFVPSVNQLRYALRDALNEIVKGKHGGLDEAIIHAKRAIYDVYEVEFLYVRTKFSNFNYDYRLMELSLVIPKYVEWKASFDSTKSKLDQISIENRDLYYEVLKPEITKLKGIVTQLESYRADLNKQLARRQRKRIFVTLTAAAALFTTIVHLRTILEWLIALFHSR